MNHVISKVANGIGLITLNRPEAINALSLDMVLRLSKILNEWAADSKIEAVAIRGTDKNGNFGDFCACLLYTSPSPRDLGKSRMPSSA